jgi:hypothetical protein
MEHTQDPEFVLIQAVVHHVVWSAGVQAECKNGFLEVKPAQMDTTAVLLGVENMG